MADATADIKIIVKDVAGALRSIDRIEKKLGSMGNASKAASRQVVVANKQMESSFNNLSKTISRGTAAIAAITGAFYLLGAAVREVSKVQAITLQLKAVSSSAEDFSRNLELVRAVSLETGTSFKENATLLARYTRALQRFGGDAGHAAVVIDTLNKAFLINGSTGSEATSVLVQLSQALTAGALSGDEFRSFAENAGSLVDALAQTMGVSVTELKKLGAQGKITADILIKTAIRMNEEYSKLFKATGELPLDRALQNIITQFEFVITKSKAFNDVFNQVGGYVTKVAELFFQLIQVVESLSFSNAAAQVESQISLWKIFGDAVYQTINIILTGIKIFVRGLQAGFNVVSYLIGSVIRGFEFMASAITQTFEFAVTTLDNLNKKANNPFTFEFGAAQTDGLDKLKNGLVKSFKEIEAVGDAEFSVLSARLDEIGGEIWDDLGQGVANALGEGTNNLSEGFLEGVRNALGDLDTPAVTSEMDKAAQKLADDFNKAMREAFRTANDTKAQLNLVTSGGDERALSALKEELDIQKQLAEWRDKGISEPQIASLKVLLDLQKQYNQELADEIKLKQDAASLNAEMAQLTRDLLKTQFEAANFSIEKSQEQLDYEIALYDIRVKTRDLLATAGPEAAAAFEKLATETLNAKTANEQNENSAKNLQEVYRSIATAGAEAFVAILDGSKSATEALKDLLKQLLFVVAQALILKALGANGSFGSILSGVVGGSTPGFGGQSAPQINVFNYGSQAGGVQTRGNSSGGVDVIIGQISSAINRGGNPLDQALRRSYGLGRVGV